MADFQEIYNLYFRGVYKYALSMSRDPVVAEEITQETFFKAMKSIGSFRGQCRLYVWLCQIAKNTYITYCQKLTRAKSEMEVSFGTTVEEHLLTKESALEIHQTQMEDKNLATGTNSWFCDFPFLVLADTAQQRACGTGGIYYYQCD